MRNSSDHAPCPRARLMARRCRAGRLQVHWFLAGCFFWLGPLAPRNYAGGTGRFSAHVDEVFDFISGLRSDYHGWPTLTRLSDGRLVVAYSGGREGHVCPFGRIEAIWSEDGGRTWTTSRILEDSPSDDRDGAISQTPAGTLLLHWATSQAWLSRVDLDEIAENWPAAEGTSEWFMPAWTESRLKRWMMARDRLPEGFRDGPSRYWMKRSEDGGITWSDSYEVPMHNVHGITVRENGDPLYFGRSGASVSVFSTPDDGRTWRELAPLPVRPGDDAREYHELHGVETASGRLVVHIRNHNPVNEGSILQTVSDDGGHTWTTPAPIGVSAGARNPSHLLLLENGDLLMTYGHRGAPWLIKTRVSRDGGESWSHPLILYSGAERSDMGYPSTVQVADGSLVTVWYETPADPRHQGFLSAARWRLIEDAGEVPSSRIEMVPVRDAGNAADVRVGAGSEGFGAVDYDFYLSRFPVTNRQYAEFLNAVAADDPNKLWVSSMGSQESGGIGRTGEPGSYHYFILPSGNGMNIGSDMSERPIGYVSFYSAARYTNWLMNGKPFGAQGPETTEDGYYTFAGPEKLIAVADYLRGSEADWIALPTEDEWYKAAYFSPELNGGAGGYFRYPTMNDTPPVPAFPPGGTNTANFDGAVGTTADVGAYKATRSYYGIYDLAGNVWEWNESLEANGNRGRRGGAFNSVSGTFLSSNRYHADPSSTISTFGIRVSSNRAFDAPADPVITYRQRIPHKESTDFSEYHSGESYEADALPAAASPAWLRGTGDGIERLAAGILTVDTINRTDAAHAVRRIHYRSNGAPGGNFWKGDFDAGFTVEARIWVEEVHDPVHGALAFSVRNGEAGGEATLQFRSDSILWWNGERHPAAVMAKGEDQTDGFQTIRIVKMPGRNEWHIWRNGKLIGSHLRAPPSGWNELLFGDTSDVRYAGRFHIDYIRWDTSGAYAPDAAVSVIPGIPSRPAMLQVVRPAIELEVRTWDGILYRLERAGRLPVWEDFSGWRRGTGESVHYFDSTLGLRRGYYRLVTDND